MSWQSTVPAAIDGMVSLLKANTTLFDVVHDGPELRQTMSNEAVFVGYTGTDEETVADGSFSSSGLVVSPDRERYSIRCAAIVLNGSGNVSVARQRAYSLFGLVGQSLASDQTLGGVVMATQLGEWAFTMAQTEEGVVATVTFNVDVDTYTQT